MSAYTILLVNLSTLRGERLAENIALMHCLETGTECTVADALIQMDVDAKWLEQYGDTKITDDNIGDPFLRGAIKKRKNEKGEEDTVYSGMRLSKYQAAASMTPVIPDYFSTLRSAQEGSTLSEKKNGKFGPDTAGKYGNVYGIQTNEASLKLLLQDTDIDELIIMATGAVYGNSLATYRGRRIGDSKKSGKDASENSNSRTTDANGLAPEMVTKGILAECLDNSLKRTGGNCCLEIEDIKDYRLFDGETDVTEDITRWSNTLDYYILEAAYYAQKGASDKGEPHGEIRKIVIY